MTRANGPGGGGAGADGGDGDGSPRRANAGAADVPNRSEALPDAVTCPFCGTRETEQFSSFGSAVSTSQYYCNRCRTVFEFMKWR